MRVLVTGGAGFIGSHVVRVLLETGHRVTVLDNLSTGRRELVPAGAAFVRGDLKQEGRLVEWLAGHEVVIHLAALVPVPLSVQRPVEFAENNVVNTVRLLEAMRRAGVRGIVFSSSATVYGDPVSVPIREDFPLSATNPYGRTKLFIEEILRDQCQADKNWQVTLLRYFNPVGAHASGLIGEDPNDIPNNLMPYICQVAIGKLAELQVFGDDYDTEDGTGVRDYIHVVDLALGHLHAVDRVRNFWDD